MFTIEGTRGISEQCDGINAEPLDDPVVARGRASWLGIGFPHKVLTLLELLPGSWEVLV
jgi:hypothetical protein